MTSLSKIGLTFTIGTVDHAYIIPVEKTVPNNFDYVAGMLSLDRIPGENNVTYRNRLFDVTVHPASSLYEGVVNGIARELGFIREKTLLIDLKTESAGDNIADKPRVDILANRIVLYRSWTSPTEYTIDKEIYFFSRDSEGYYLDDLVTSINSSDCFTATIYPGIRTNLHSFLLVRGTSNNIVLNDLVRSDYMTYFTNGNVVRGTLWFEEKDIFNTEVSRTPTGAGEYQVNYKEGWVRSAKLPSGRNRCGYRSSTFPLKVDSVPIQAFSLFDDDFIYELHRQEILASGEDTEGLPNGEGAEIYHQLFEETRVFWGE
jgi:hypothetical protein